jgi:hypothetical protein
MLFWFSLHGIDLIFLSTSDAQWACFDAMHQNELLNVLFSCALPKPLPSLIIWGLVSAAIWFIWRASSRVLDGQPRLLYDEQGILGFGWYPTLLSGCNWIELPWQDIVTIEGNCFYSAKKPILGGYYCSIVLKPALATATKNKKIHILDSELGSDYSESLLRFLVYRRPDLAVDLALAMEAATPPKGRAKR